MLWFVKLLLRGRGDPPKSHYFLQIQAGSGAQPRCCASPPDPSTLAAGGRDAFIKAVFSTHVVDYFQS